MHGWSEKTVSWKKFSNDSSNEREEDVYVRRIEDSSKKLETRHPSIPRSTRCTIDSFAKAKRVLAPLALLSRRRNFGGPCTLAIQHIPVRSLHNVQLSNSSDRVVVFQLYSARRRRFRGARPTRCTAAKLWFRVRPKKRISATRWHRARASITRLLIGHFRT